MPEKKYTPHVHAEIIKAWADGKTIEWRKDATSAWRLVEYPNFVKEYQYRVNPEELVDYTIVFSEGTAGANYRSTKESVQQLYNHTESIQGYCKRTTVDGKVVAFEFIPV